jgi:hypothetical protein
MPAPINVKLHKPTITIPDWPQEAQEWEKLNQEVGGNSDFYPLTIKAAYVIGVIHDLCESVSHLLKYQNKNTTYISAYGVFASGVELLGRCINGNSTTKDNTKDLNTGFKWLANSDIQTVSDSDVLVATSSFNYTIEMLMALRHYAAHGQATSRKTGSGTYQFGNIDFEILSKMPPLLADGLERYWSDLQQSDELCNKLAKANVIALRNWPVGKSWLLFEKDKDGKYHGVYEIFSRFVW